MSKRGQADLEAEGNTETQPVRRSGRISSGQNATSSPAPRAITTRRSSANSISEKVNAETTASPMDKRRTRRTSTDDEPKATPIRTRRSSVSKVIEEEKTSTPNSPSRRNTRLSSSSPNLDVPARRTRRSSQDSETVEIPARRSTRGSSTGLQETTIEELIEKPKPITRRRRSASVEELEENVEKKVEVRNKTRRLFNEESQLAPIVEQEQEVKEKETVAEKDAPLGVIEELADEEADRIMRSIDEVLEEGNRPESEKSESKCDEIPHEEENEIIASPKKVVEEQPCNQEQKESNEQESLEDKSSPKKRLSLVSDKSSLKPKECATEGTALEIEPQTELSKTDKQSPVKEIVTENTFNSPSPKKIASSSTTPVTQSKNHADLVKDDSLISTEKESDQDEEQMEKKIGIFASPGSDKENTTINICKKRISLELIEKKTDSKPEKNVFVVEKTPRNSFYEPMEVDVDEDEVFIAETSINQSSDKLIANISSSGETRHSVLRDGSPKAATCPEEINRSIKDDSFAMHGSFSQLNSSPDKDSPLIEKSNLSTPHKSSTLENVKYPSTPISQDTDNNDSESETSIKLVDTDEEEEEARRKAVVPDEKVDNAAAEIVAVSELDESILDKSFGSDKNQSSIEKISETKDPADDPTEGCLMIKSDSEENIKEFVESNHAKDMGKFEHAQVTVQHKGSEICDVEEGSIEVSNHSVSLNKSVKNEVTATETTEENLDGSKTEDLEIVKSPRKSVINSPQLRAVSKKSENNQICSSGQMKNINNEDQDSEENISQIKESKTDVSLVKTEKDADSSVNETQNNSNIVKLESEIETNSVTQLNDLNNSGKSIGESSEDLTVDPVSLEEKTDDENILKSVVDSPSKIILQSVKVIKQSEEENNSIREKKLSRISLSHGEICEKQEKADKKQKITQMETRHSLPNKIRGEQNIAQINRRKSIAAVSINEKSAKQVKDSNEKDDTSVNESIEAEINIISSEDEDNTSLGDNSTRKYSSIDSEEEKGIEKKTDTSITETSVKELTNKKRRSKETGESNKTRIDTKEKTENTKQVAKSKSPEKRRSRRNKNTIEILSRCGIDVEDEEEESDQAHINEFFDDMAEEGEESLGEEEDDENEIKDEGESILSSDEEVEGSEDEYDPNDSFIDDEEEELLSGEEDFLGHGKKKKYRKIIRPTSSSSSDVSNEPVENDKEKIPSNSEIKHIQIEENDIEGPVQNLKNEKSFEKFVDSILKANPDDSNAPTETTTDDMNSSVVAESSVILQETCSIGAAKNKILKNKINGVVDAFCQNITETEGNISLNVSLNYKPPQNSFNASMERSNSETNDENILQRSLNTSPFRLSNENKKASISPHKLNIVENIDIELADLETIAATSSKSPRLSKEKINRISSSPIKCGEEKLLGDNETVMPEIVENIAEKNSKKTKKRKKSKGREEKLTEKSSSDSKKLQKSNSSKDEEKTENISNVQTELLEKKKRNKEHSGEEEEEGRSEHSDQKPKSKKRRNENLDNKDAKEEPKEKPTKKRIRFDNNSQLIPGEIKRKRNKQSEDKEKNKDKKGKRKNIDLSDKEVPSKKLCVSFKPSDLASKNLKEIKPTKLTYNNKESKKLKNKHKTELKATSLNERNDWEEEEVDMQPSAANTSVSGFNIEMLVNGGFKNRIIYDMSRNKRVPSVLSKIYRKK